MSKSELKRRLWMMGALAFCLTRPATIVAQPVMENLGRGIVVVRSGETSAYVSWRLLATDPTGVAFNLYRAAGERTPIRLNTGPLTETTDFVDASIDPTVANTYTVRAVSGGRELDPARPFVLPANAPVRQYLTVTLQKPPDGKVSAPSGTLGTYSYNANDASAADLDGDGEYEIVLKWDPSNSRDTASAGVTGTVLLDAYRLDGTHLWRIDLGRNIRAGAHYTQFIVYDLDADGRAEVACKTADGTVDGRGTVLGDGSKDYRSLVDATDGVRVTSTADLRYGKILAGPEYLTIFDGLTGAALATAEYIPAREPLDGWGGIGGNGRNDATGNRVDRFLAGAAYLDGRLPSVVMARGYYGRTVLAAWDWRGGKLATRWVFDSGSTPPPYPNPAASPFSGQGNHSLSVADVDADGRDEIIYGSMVVDDQGKGLFSTGLRHGDALHVGDLDPARPGLEVFGIHENEDDTVKLGTPGLTLYDARAGEIIWGLLPGVDVGRGLAADIDPRYRGAEFWTDAPTGLLDVRGKRISDAPASSNFAVWWDADLVRELLDRNWVAKWDPASASLNRLLTAEGTLANNGGKATPSLSADLFGDWREEVVWRSADNASLRIYTTTIPAANRLVTPMHDRTYRLAIAWQNVGYNQPPHPGFYLGDGMQVPALPRIAVPKR